MYSEVRFIQGQVKANLENAITSKKEEMKLQDKRADLEKEIVGMQMTRRIENAVARQVEKGLSADAIVGMFANKKSFKHRQN